MQYSRTKKKVPLLAYCPVGVEVAQTVTPSDSSSFCPFSSSGQEKGWFGVGLGALCTYISPKGVCHCWVMNNCWGWYSGQNEAPSGQNETHLGNVQHLCPVFAQTHQTIWPSIGILSEDIAWRESHSCTSSHCQSYSENLQDDHKTSSRWKLAGHIYFAAGHWPAGKTHEDTLWAAAEEQLLTVPVHSKESFYNLPWTWLQRQTGNFWDCQFKAMYRKSGEQTTVEKMDRHSFVGVGKDLQGCKFQDGS